MLQGQGRRRYAEVVGLLTLVLAQASGCSSTRLVSISSDPPGAEIFIDKRSVGIAPLETKVRGRWIYQDYRARHKVTARAPGYQSGLYYLEPTEPFLPGAIGCWFLLGCPWKAQIPDEVNLTLHPTDSL